MTEPISKPIFDDYNEPLDIVADPRLSVAQKDELLESWAVSEEALAKATSEGLTGGRQSKLRAVQIARKALDDFIENLEHKSEAAQGDLDGERNGQSH